MPADLEPKVRVLFASGTKLQNEAAVAKLALEECDWPLVVVAEFEPAEGEWIPFHVGRTFLQSEAAVRAALAGRRVESAVVLLAQGTAYGPMRVLAGRVAGKGLRFYGEGLREVSAWKAPLELMNAGPLKRWVRRIAHPSEVELPLRARMAQVEGEIGSRIRASGQELPLGGFEPLEDGVTVVVPSRDGRELLEALFPALLPQLGAGEVIVVDNGSSDGTCGWLKDAYPAVRTIETELPLSFSRAVSAGIVEARRKYILLLNNDMVVEPGFVAALEAAFASVPDLFCATAQIFFPAGIRREETGKAVWRRENPLDFPVRCDDPLEGEDFTPVLYGSGGCSLFDTARLRELGGVSEVYEPAYVEDMDFGYRAWKRGWATVFCAGARVEHRHRATTSRFFSARELDFFVERNYLRFLIHAVGSAALFRRLWKDAVRRLHLLGTRGNEAALDTLRKVPAMGPKPPEATGAFSESEILALGNGDLACFPGREPGGKKVVAIASPYVPFPLSHGGAVRIFNLMKVAAESADLVLIAFCEELAPPARELLDLCSEVVLVRRHGTHFRRSTALPDTVLEFESETFRAALKYTVGRWKPQVVQLEFTWMAQYAEACAPARTVLVEHDITFDLQEQLLAAGVEKGAERWELEQQLVKWRSFETAAWGRVDCVVTMSAKDTAVVKGAGRVVTLPNGVDCERFGPAEESGDVRRLLFIGSFGHLPNVRALQFFLEQVWPRLGPGYTLHVIAGKYEHIRVPFDLNLPGIEVEGFVSDVRPAYRQAQMVLAPLTASAGTNIKVLEAMAMGRVVVTTAAGMNGLDLSPGEDVVLVDGAAEMATAIGQLSDDAERRHEMERRARRTALRFDWKEIGKDQAALYSL